MIGILVVVGLILLLFGAAMYLRHGTECKEPCSGPGYDYWERELEDDNPIFVGYWYIIDGEPIQSPIEGTVGDWRKQKDFNKITYADIRSRGLEPVAMQGGEIEVRVFGPGELRYYK